MAVTETAEYQLVSTIRDHLERDLLTNIDEDDEALVTSVTVGKFTESPYGIHLVVHADHPLGFSNDKLDSSAEYRGSRAERFHPGLFPAESIGGYKWRRIHGTVEIRSVQKGVTPAEAVAIIALVKTRILQSITNDITLTRIVDTFEHQVVGIEMAENYGYASGGGRTSVDRHWCDWVATVAYPRGYTGV